MAIGTYCLAAAVEFMMSGEDELILKENRIFFSVSGMHATIRFDAEQFGMRNTSFRR